MKIMKMPKGADWFYLGIYLHNVGILLFWSLQLSAYKFLVYLGPISFLYGFWVNRKHMSRNRKPFSYYLLLSISLLMWLRFDINGANGGTVQDISGAFAMFFFLLLLYDCRLFRLEDMKRWATIAAVTGIAFSLANWNRILAANAYQEGSYSSNEGAILMAMAAIYTLMGMGFFLFAYRCNSRSFTLFSLFTTMLAVVIAMTSGRRGYTVINLMYVVQFVCMSVIYSKGAKRMWSIISAILFIIGCYYYYLTFKDTQLAMFFNRLDSDSRSTVFLYWDKEMAKSGWYWVCGKGVSGGYWDGGFAAIRPNIENGVRHMILKGGLLYFGSYIALTLHMAYLGWFKSNNKLLKGTALYIICLFIFIFVWGAPSISYIHLFMWMGYTWICNPQLRKMNDAEVMKCLYSTYVRFPKNRTVGS